MNPAASFRLRGEIESPLPLHAPAGQVEIAGWCLAESLAEPPPVRLRTAVGVLALSARVARTDVPVLLPAEPAAARSGFVIRGRLPAGVHLAHFEAQLPDDTWSVFKILTLAVGARPFAAAVESPAATGVLRERRFVEGWAFHPEGAVTELVLRYGHQEVGTRLGGARPDLAARFPDSPHAATAGFTSWPDLSPGFGTLRFRAKLADGSTAVARSELAIDINDDRHPHADLDLHATRVSLPGHAAHSPGPPPVASPRPLNVLFVLPGSFASNSALHVAALANELAAAGHACAVAVAHDRATLAHLDRPRFRGLTHAEAEIATGFPDGRAPDVIHTWTTRENVRRLTEKIRARHSPRVVVHLEDNERQLLALTLGRDADELERLAGVELDPLVPPDLSHPHRSREFLAAADGVTVITARLREFVPTAQPVLVLRPAADARHFYPRPCPAEFRRLLDTGPDETVLFYPGNVHAANVAEVGELYAAVIGLNRRGVPVTLIRTGQDTVDLPPRLAADAAPHVLHLGQILHHRHLAPLLALADIFVQPGGPDAFNDYRFPSKLPEFFALGRPVVLPRTNLGIAVRHRVDAYVLDRADAAGIAAAVETLRGDRSLYDALARGATAFARDYFSWARSAAELDEFYHSLLAV